jgi:hypothetical protein
MDYDELINYACLDGLNRTLGCILMINISLCRGFDDKTCNPSYIWE